MKTLILTMLLLLAATTFGQQSRNDKAIVYVYSYSTTTTIGQIRKPVFLDGKEIADIRPERFFIALVEPGKHIFHLKNKKFGGIEKDFQAGTTYYIRIDWRNNGLAIVPGGFLTMPAENGAFDIKQLRPIDKGNVKDSAVVKLSLES